MRSRTPEELVLVGTIVETYQRSGKHVANITIDPIRIDLETDGTIEMHLGDKIAMTASVTITAARPHLSRS